MKQPQLTFNGELFLQAIVNTWLGDTTTMTIMQAMQVLQSEPQEGVEYEAVPAEKCPSEQAEVELKNHMDSVNYASALYYISQYKPMLEQMDTITPKEQMFDLFVENVNKGLKLKVQGQNAYFGGRQIGNMLRQTEEKDEGLGGFEDIKLNFDILFQGVINGLNDYEEMMSKEEAMQFLQELSLNRQFGEWKKQNEQWLTDNQKKDSIQTTASGLQYKVIREGNGEHPAAIDTVVVDYEGSLINDTVFDSSYKRGEPLKFALNGVIAGWTEGLQLMSPGAKYMLYIPQELAYGERNQGIIQPFSTLIFTVELKKVIKATPQAAPAQENSDIQIQKIN
jgi:FKBP-type peptidyl-prolyl cis-trans isomerase FklB